MANERRPEGLVDAVQTFRVPIALQENSVDMATSPNSHIAVLQLAPGEKTHTLPQASDQILVVLKGECSVEAPSGAFALERDHGMMIPPSVSCAITNTAQTELVFLTMRSQRPTAPVSNVTSDILVKIPAEQINAKGLGHSLYAYVMDRRTIGISPLIMEEWNQVSAMRMNCKYEKVGDQVVARLPQRIVGWYHLAELTDSDYTLLPARNRTRVRVDLTPFIERQALG